MGRLVYVVFLWCFWNVACFVNTSEEVWISRCRIDFWLDGLVVRAPGGYPALCFLVVVELTAEREDPGIKSSHELGRNGVRALYSSRLVSSARLVQGYCFIYCAGEEFIGNGKVRTLN